ncbi:hypothetical protein Amet_1351 [Alkaliphilus metalliredigens QYMF]|uniref:Uncharacterized protein n=1 Tax=Alkaliphilus metalliredigens (strain QYMF) TaxID=293826 RepID=A6TMY3_ALKMQ|nr:hypothetical protein [Alkaliphilus metalliredigens]ABR47551.1 hypothetical protein Amet_1351 [Alkaliphilus metalliredigens QYMF]
MKHQVRAIEEMPQYIKLIYCKLLTYMVDQDRQVNQLKMKELYRIMAKIQLNSKGREVLLEFLTESKNDINTLYNEIHTTLEGQEYNIFRFSLMKDFMIVMGADYIHSAEELELIKNIKKMLSISIEQYEFIEKEYRSDENFLENHLEEEWYQSLIKETIAQGTAIGIPVASLAVIRHCHRSRYVEPTLTDRILGRQKNKELDPGPSIGATLALGVVTYYGVKWILNRHNRQESELRRLTIQEAERLHERAKEYILEDISHLSTEPNLEINLEQTEHDKILGKSVKLITLLEKTLATYHSTKPIVI